jgi:Putative Actinobacterial Holin-X, holin superfamily III
LAPDAKDDTTTVGRLKAAGGGTLQLIVDYVKQETLQPLKGLGRFVLFGIVGSVALGIGLVILAIAFLRVLQGETGTTFAGNWSWAPYLICTVALVVVAVVAVAAVQRGQAKRQLQPESKENA